MTELDPKLYDEDDNANPLMRVSEIRPLRRIGFGVWRSRDERWTFMRHQGDSHPQRWFTYEGDSDDPYWWDGPEVQTLGNAVAAVEALSE